MTIFKIRLYTGTYVINEQKFRINRILKPQIVKNIFLDIRAPKQNNISKVEVIIENGHNEHKTWVDNLKVELFDKKQK